MSTNAIKKDNFYVLEEEEKEAMRRFFAGEEPTFSTGVCEFLTGGYGVCSDYGYFEFPLPAPVDQWQKRTKPFDIKIKMNGIEYAARIIPFGSNEIIKRNYIFATFLYCDPSDDAEEMAMKHAECIKTLKENVNSTTFLPTKAVGENVQEHKERIYLEVVSSYYPANGLTEEEYYNTPPADFKQGRVK